MNIKELYRPCPICLNSKCGEILHTQKFMLPDNHILPSQYDVVSCANCGFVFADTQANQETYDRYYAEMSKYEMDYTESNTSMFVERAAWINTVIHDKNAEIIDVGCGNGQLLLELRKLGFSNITAFDPSQKCIRTIQQLGINGVVGSIFDITSSMQYDTIILSGVLEHICNVTKLMKTLKSLSKPGGLLLVCVPDASRYRDYDTVPYDYFNIEHINHFDETSLINLGFFHGLQVVNFFKTTISFLNAEQPVIFCAYRNEGNAATDWRRYSTKMMLAYINHTQKNETFNHVIGKLAKSGEELVIWGAGNYTSRLLAVSNLSKCNILMLIDNDKHKQGTSINGKPVCPPNALLNTRNFPTILVASAI
ncbi:MAG: methyltransferase domain-containing protein [Lentisphaerota bacterium]